METVRIPLFNPAIKNIDESESNDEARRIMDLFISAKGHPTRRPGLGTHLVDLGTAGAVDGLYWWSEREVVVAVSNGSTFILTWDGNNITSTDVTGTTLKTDVRPTFCTDGTRTFMANGGPIHYTDSSSVTALIADTDAPQEVTHVSFIDGAIIASQAGTNKFYFAEFNDYSDWSALNFASAAGAPDVIVAQVVFSREVYLIGKRTTELWQNDGQNPFSRVGGGFIEVGCIAPYSIVIHETGVIWLTNKRKFIRYNGNGVEEIPCPFSQEIEDMAQVADCQADTMTLNGMDLILFAFIASNRTLVYNLTKKEWYEWGKWNSGSGSWDRYLGNVVCNAEDWGLTLVGSRVDGKIYASKLVNNNDGGQTIRTSQLTGLIDYGSLDTKRSSQIRLRVKRGETASAGKLIFRWKDDNAADWSVQHEIDLGEYGDRNPVVQIDRCGSFVTRQYELICTDNVPLIYGSAEEDVEVLK